MNMRTSLIRILPKRVLSFIHTVRLYSFKGIKADLLANSTLKKASLSKSKNDTIRVAFVVQMAEIWDKASSVYDAMKADPRFDAELIVAPDYDRVIDKIKTSFENDNYFLNTYHDAIPAIQDGEWIKIEKGRYDYVFLLRPYEHYLPEELQSANLAKVSKVCYIPYGFTGADVFIAGGTNKAFFRNVYFAFLESDYVVSMLKKQFLFPAEKKMHRILSIGYPALVPFFSFPKSEAINSIMWTPRWSFDHVIGGSNFLNYKNEFLELAKTYQDLRFVFRPHPLMFGEILKQGFMTQEEIEKYINEIERAGIIYDRNTTPTDSLKTIDLLITDFSSMIAEFFVTGRPIIYCESCIKVNDVFQTMKEGMYVVNYTKDFYERVSELINVGDSKKQEREDLIKSQFYIHKNAIENIVEEIYSDYLAANAK